MNTDQKIWFTADTHFGHAGVIKFCNRPYTSADEMDEAIIKHWNSKINKQDLVYHLGDLSFYNKEVTEKLVARLNGRIHLVLGNHDKHIRNVSYFDSIQDIKLIKPRYKGVKHYFILAHRPMLTWEQSSKYIHLHGHCHGSLPESRELRFDMGYDCSPIYSLEEVIELVEAKKQKNLAETGKETYMQDYH